MDNGAIEAHFHFMHNGPILIETVGKGQGLIEQLATAQTDSDLTDFGGTSPGAGFEQGPGLLEQADSLRSLRWWRLKKTLFFNFSFQR